MEGIFSYFEDELLYLACGTDYQFQIHAITIANPLCQYSWSILVWALDNPD